MKKLLTCCILSIALVTSLIGCSISDTDTPTNTSTEKETPKETTPEPVKEESKPDDAVPESEKAEKPKEEPTNDEKIDFESDSGKLVYTKHEVINDYEDNPAIVIYFDYTNLSDKSSASMFSFSITPFQNGIECETAIITKEIKEIDNSMKEVKKDVTLPVAFAFALEDKKGDVELEVSDLFSFDDTKDTQTLKIK